MDWRPLPYSDLPVRLYVGGAEVARLCSRLDGTWYAMLNQHRHWDDPERRSVDCTSFELGKAGVEIWATREIERLEREVLGQWESARDRV